MIRVATIGAASSANKGAASMLQALLDHLPETVGPCEVAVLTTYPEADAAEPPAPPEGVALRLVDASPLRLAALQVPLAAAARLAGGRAVDLAEREPAVAALRHADLVVDLAGISFSDGRGVPTLAYNTLMTGLPLLSGAPTVKLAQALGPFDEPLNRVVAPFVLRRLAAVCPRGDASTRNVERLGLARVHPAADLAFLMRVPDTAHEAAAALVGEGPYVAVMPSVVAQRRAARLGIDYLDRVAALVQGLVDDGHRPLVVPHSTGGRPGGRMDDRDVCRALAAAVPSASRIDASLAPPVLRAIIARSDALVTSRFHAVVSALATDTPVLAIGWGHKYTETMRDLGVGEWCHDVGALTGDALAPALRALLADRDGVRATIADRRPAAEARARVNLEVVRTVVGGAVGGAVGGQVSDSLAGVIESGMCIGCGACTAADPSVRLELDPVRRTFRPDRPSGPLAASVCPGVGVDFAGLHAELFPGREVTPYGVVEHVWLAQSTDEGRNRRASSGGLIKELLLELLARDDVDGAIALDHGHGLDFHPRLLTSAEEVDALPGSIYHALDLSAALDILRSTEGRFVLVAIPCQLEGIHQYVSRVAPELRERIHTTIGLLCGWQYSHRSIDAMLDFAGMADGEVADVSYRGGGPVGRLRIDLADGRAATASRRVDLDYQVAFDRSFNAPRCHLCVNHSNFFADVVVGDAWLPATVFTRTGISLVICRRPETEALVRDLAAAGRVTLTEASVGEIRSSQGDRVVFGGFAYAYAEHLARLGIHRPEMVGPNRGAASLAPPAEVARFHREQVRKARLRHAGRYRALRRRKVTVELPGLVGRYGRWFSGRILRRQDKVSTSPITRDDLAGFR